MIGRLVARLVAVTMLASGCGERAVAVPEAVPLGAVRDEHREPFTGPILLVELRDGRVLAYDAREGVVTRIDFDSRTAALVSRKGDGPLEFRSGLALARATADSVWMLDLMRGRILVFSPDGEPVRGFDMTGGRGARGRVSAPWLVAVDSRGGWYGRVRALFEPASGGGFAESTAVVRVRSETALHDTLAMLLSEGAQGKTLTGLPRLSSFDPYDAFGVLRDGHVIVVRGATYRVEVVDSAGVVHDVGPVTHERVPLTVAAMREEADSINRMMRGLLAMSFARLPLSAGQSPPTPEYAVPYPAPTHWPVLMSDQLPVDHQDRAWVAVRDASLATSGQRYDLLDRDGRWTQAIRIPPGLVLVGFGATTLYVARRDADDLLWLGRYPLPE